MKKTVLWIRIGSSSDSYPDLDFYLDAKPDPGSQTHADRDPYQILKTQKVLFLYDTLRRSKTNLRSYKSLLVMPETRFIC